MRCADTRIDSTKKLRGVRNLPVENNYLEYVCFIIEISQYFQLTQS